MLHPVGDRRCGGDVEQVVADLDHLGVHHQRLADHVGAGLVGRAQELGVGLAESSAARRSQTSDRSHPRAQLVGRGVTACFVEHRRRPGVVPGQPRGLPGGEQPAAGGLGGLRVPRRALAGRRRHGVGSAGRGARGHRVKLGGHGLIGPERGRAEVPGPSVGVPRRKDPCHQRVQTASFGRGRSGVHGGPGQRMHEHHPVRAGLDQSGLLGAGQTLDRDAGHGARPPHGGEVLPGDRDHPHRTQDAWVQPLHPHPERGSRH